MTETSESKFLSGLNVMDERASVLTLIKENRRLSSAWLDAIKPKNGSRKQRERHICGNVGSIGGEGYHLIVILVAHSAVRI